MDHFEKVKVSITHTLQDKKQPWAPSLQFIEEKTGIPRMYLFIGGVAFAVLYLIFGYAAQLLCNVISVIYPAYVSIKAIESNCKADDTQWLTYWVLYAVFSIIEFFYVFVVNFIPFYYLIKCAFFIWCMLPMKNNGSFIIYNRFILPYFLKHQTAADKAIEDLIDKSKDIVADVIKNADLKKSS